MDLNKILPLVQRPGRYTNGELNSIHKKSADCKVCFCFPDLYEIGASNLGLEILYHIVNSKQNALAERCYSPSFDMEAELRKNNMPLFSLESKTPLKQFDIIGITLQYELCATNILNMLDLAGLPVLASERKDIFPLVIGGGPLTANPEPLAEFFDLFVLGEGEEVICEITDKISELKNKVNNKFQLLLELSKISGVYIPSFYEVEYNDDKTIKSFNPKVNDVPKKIQKRVVKLDETQFPAKQIVPFLQTIHNRLNIEIARGCPGQCRFCQATKYYSPWRMRSQENILKLVEEGLESTGYEEVAFSSLSCTDYKGLEGLLDKVNSKYGCEKISISLPSLRCDRFSVMTAANLNKSKRSNLTFAPEAGTERLRAVIGKNLSQQNINDTIMLAWKLGWKLIKLYFMLGLPTENDEDIDGIVNMVKEIKKVAGNLNFNVTLSPFVPKPQTSFQWAKMASRDDIKTKMVKLKKLLPAAVKGHFVDSSLLEAVLARGDRRLGKVILHAWQNGSKFDQWKEHFQFHVWEEAFKANEIDADFYMYREKTLDEILPWDHLIFGGEKEKLINSYKKSLEKVEMIKEILEKEIDVKHEKRAKKLDEYSPKVLQRLRIKFSRTGGVRFLSHLDQIEVFRRVIRRADLPVAYSSGFSPQIKMAFGPAISVGYESESEYVELELVKKVNIDEIKEKIINVLPIGFNLLSIKPVPIFFPSLDALVNIAEYEVDLKVDKGNIDRLMELREIIIEKKKKGKTVQIDARPLLNEVYSRDGKLMIKLRFGPKKNIKVEKIVQMLTGISENESKIVRIKRKSLLVEKTSGQITEP